MTSSKPKKPSRKWALIIAVIVLIVVVIGYVFHNHNKLEISYREFTVKRGDISVTILSTGTVAPENRLEIKPPVAGRVDQVLAKEGQYVKKGQILAWMSSTERAALIDAARAQGPKELKKWEADYRATPILAPINGTIILRNVEDGQTFTNTDAVFVMSDRLTVQAQVDETDISQIHMQQEASIVLDAYPQTKIAAQVDQIAFDAKTVNNVTTYIVDVLPKETPEFMRSGMTANVSFFVADKQGVLLVPNEALHTKDGKYTILLKDPAGNAPVEKPIEIGLTDGKRTEVISGVGEGDVVLAAEITAGQNKSGSNPFSPFRPKTGRGGGGSKH